MLWNGEEHEHCKVQALIRPQVPQIKCQRLKHEDQTIDLATLDGEEDSTYMTLQLVVKRGRLVVGAGLLPELAFMNSKATLVLLEAFKFGVELRLFVTRKDLRFFLQDEASNKHTAFLYVDANVLGPEDSCEDVGALLSKHGVYLQDPRCPDSTREYSNPHVMDLGVEQIDIWFQELAMDLPMGANKANENTDWNIVLDDLPQQHNFNATAVEVDTAIVTTQSMQ